MHNYVVRVRGKAYAWGSSEIHVDLQYPLLLVVNNDMLGDPVELRSENVAGGVTALGTLHPGECWTIPLEGLRGVSANCSTDTSLACSLLIPQLGPQQ
ncbi:hypothetical protein CURE108131_04265 [Cupriavidus respiraculi]|uniref:Uncharacterized protein n=1 Tax=Cupriavidus respiraculi TaxID=195930 RepID=A0ABM8WJ11_9BURK|nr:hypothetical protein [Cupriavidus respiraculi]MBY4948155.1 hypothetical protein [Cupriavidus respiraculi]CAG9167342.1 hypothetical protein LMG21510_00725 [Cupriavidus respiraculi]